MTEREIESERVRRERLLLDVERTVLYCTAQHIIHSFHQQYNACHYYSCVCLEYRSAVGIYIRLCCREV